MFAIGLVGFAVTSLLCGIAPTMEFLIVCRIVQGAAGALLVPGLAGHHHRHLPGRGAGTGLRPLGRRVGARDILGPFVGGLLVNTISWRMAFLIDVPFLLIAYLATVRSAGVPRRRGHRTLRLARLAGGRRRRRRTGLRDDPRPAARMERADRHGELTVGAVAAIASRS